MLNRVQHDGVVAVSLRTPPLRHPEFISGSLFEMLNRVQHDGVVGC